MIRHPHSLSISTKPQHGKPQLRRFPIIKAYQDDNPGHFVKRLKELNKLHEKQCLDSKREAVRDLFGDEVAIQVSTRLADDLLFLHNYFMNKVDLSLNDKQKVREYVVRMYELEGTMPPNVHDTLVLILTKCDALETY